MPDIRAPTIAQAIFDNWVCRYGVMPRLHSDGAKNVDGEVMRQLCILMGIKKSKSSRLHPEGDGISEAGVKQIKSIIQKFVDEHGKNWDLYLQPAAFAIRSSIHNGTGLTPAELVMGGTLKHPTDLPSTTELHTAPLNVRQARNYARLLKGRIDESTRIVQTNLERSRRQMKETYDKNATSHEFHVGDQVMLWDPPHRKGVSRAFQPMWNAPWTIVRLIESTNCELRNQAGGSKYVHLNQLKRVSIRDATFHRDPSLDQGSAQDQRYSCDLEPQQECVDPSIFDCFPIPQQEPRLPDHVPRFPIDHAYVDVDNSNILGNRLRIRR